ncbi:MAG: SusC/RagA family TonB-linked outer membrane protein [Bacteroidales bacterium]|nr:SusC/RagA family TonB-linked outer membrane protein [Bacteroidales bacterium]
MSTLSLFAQGSVTVSGTVNDVDGNPLPGVNVVIKGTSTGVVGDAAGKYSISVPDRESVLVFSFLGYATQEITVGDRTVISVTLNEDATEIEEVVVVGYGTMKKKDLTGAIAQIKTDKLDRESPGSVQDLLRSNMPGLNVGINTEAKGGGSMQIRGQRSLKANNDPLLVVDGLIFFGELSEINPSDIEQIDMLKDASSAAVYGAKSANGVILITTRKGRTQKPVIRFDASIGAATLGPAQRKIYDAEGYLKYREDLYISKNRFENPEKFTKPTPENLSRYGITLDEWLAFEPAKTGEPEDLWLQRLNLYEQERKNYADGKTYDWWDASFQTGIRQDYNASISGMSDMFNYYWSLGYMDNTGIVAGDRYHAYRSNLKLDATITKWLSVGANINFQNRVQNDLKVVWQDQIINNSPYSLPVDENGEIIRYPMGNTEGGTTNSEYDNRYKDKDNGWSTFNTSINAKLKLPFNITYQLTFAPRMQWHHWLYHESSQNVYWGDNGKVERESVRNFDWQVDNVINWDQTFADKHQFVVTLMQGAEDHKKWQEKITARDFSPTDALGYHYVNVANMQLSSISSDDTHSTGDALMARLFYSYDSRYMLTASIRRDGYSAFGVSHPHSTFPALALAWNFSRESFFNWTPMNEGKLRLSWGQNGNRDIGIYQALSSMTLGSGKYIYVGADGQPKELSQLWADRMANHGLRWESTSSWNVGLDFGFLRNRISGSIDAYYMPTTDLLMDQSLPVILGYDVVLTNLGEVVNKGLEISVHSVNMERENFSWRSSFGFSMNRNKIVHLYYEYEDVIDTDGNVIGQKERDDISKKWFIDHDIKELWDYRTLGVWQQDEADEAAKYNLFPGDMKVQDVVKPGETEPNYKYDNDDKDFLGYENPRYRLSLRNEFTLYKNLDLSFVMYSYLGHKALTNTPGNYSGFPERVNSYTRKYWTPDNPTNDYARLASTNPGNISPSFVRSKSFVRLDNISIAYNVPKRWSQKLQIEKLQIYGSIRNVAVWAPDWEYWDPEWTYNSDDRTSPTPRYYTVGINITL